MKSIIIKPDGNVLKIYEPGDEELGLTKRRASHVEPVNRVLRGIFHLLRGRCADDSVMAAFTRKWPCKWRARVFNGPTLGPFRRRSDAIEAEIEHIEKSFLEEK